MNREIKYIRHRLKELKIFGSKLRKLKQFNLAEVLDDVITEIEDSLKIIEKKLK